MFLFPNKVEAAWFDDSWGYRQRIPIDTHTASETNVYNEIVVDTATLTTDKLQADCDDLRFTKENGQLLPYQIVSGCDTATTTIRVGFDTMPIAPFNIYMYYGNPSASSNATTFATWNPSDKSASITLSGSDLTATGPTSGSTFFSVRATMGKSSGKWYWETTGGSTAYAGNVAVGIGSSSQTLTPSGTLSDLEGLRVYESSTGNKFTPSTACGESYLKTDIIGYKLDMDGGTLVMQENGVDKCTVVTGLSGTFYPYITLYGVNPAVAVIANFGASTFNYPAPSGYNSGVYTGNSFIFSACANGCAEGTAATEEKSPAPVAYWKFDDATGTNAQDSSPNNLDGTTSGATWQTEDQCISGKCLYFDGTAGYVSVANSTTLQSATALTMSAWFKSQDTTANRGIIRKDTTSGTRYLYGLVLNTTANKLTAQYNNGADFAVTSSGNVNDGLWHHAVMTISGTTLTLYIDGVSQGTSTITGTQGQPNGELDIGALPPYVGPIAREGFLKGFIDEVKVYNFALTAAQVKTNYISRSTGKGTSAVLGSNNEAMKQLSNGLVGYWKMDEATWTSDCATEEVLDASGNSNNGESCPSADATDPTTGKYGNAGSFDV
ncbi:MAG: hypothetical protein G01um10145_950 [Microgenomates group bacterium Gr01-1014_5]|nr:MAG: hypothetical protein G01um10145_950 [Microgenomates group bacterium Gr01-1014_5]